MTLLAGLDIGLRLHLRLHAAREIMGWFGDVREQLSPIDSKLTEIAAISEQNRRFCVGGQRTPGCGREADTLGGAPFAPAKTSFGCNLPRTALW